MEDSLKKFTSQFLYNPEIIGGSLLLSTYSQYTVVGMGGSALSADLIRVLDPTLPLTVHRDYGLPPHAARGLVIVNSYSGNTEEDIDALHEARRHNIPVIAVSTGGALLEEADSAGIPYIKLPAEHIQPRVALGHDFKALVKIMNLKLLDESTRMHDVLEGTQAQEAGRSLSETIASQVPIIYTSTAFGPIGYIWKIAFNETGKTPAFNNVFPELNHNEIESVGVRAKEFSRLFHFLFLRSSHDHQRIQKRMDITEDMYRTLGYPVTRIPMRKGSSMYEVFSLVLQGLWAAHYLAERLNVDSERVSTLEEFKKKLAS